MKRTKTYHRASHFICSHYCRFGRTTVRPGVNYLISSVGDMCGAGSKEIGYGRTYETYVFRWKQTYCKESGCACGGAPVVRDFSEVEGLGANSEAECLRNHRALVIKYLSPKKGDAK